MIENGVPGALRVKFQSLQASHDARVQVPGRGTWDVLRDVGPAPPAPLDMALEVELLNQPSQTMLCALGLHPETHPTSTFLADNAPKF